jgi:hypothetical protein
MTPRGTGGYDMHVMQRFMGQDACVGGRILYGKNIYVPAAEFLFGFQ